MKWQDILLATVLMVECNTWSLYRSNRSYQVQVVTKWIFLRFIQDVGSCYFRGYKSILSFFQLLAPSSQLPSRWESPNPLKSPTCYQNTIRSICNSSMYTVKKVREDRHSRSQALQPHNLTSTYSPPGSWPYLRNRGSNSRHSLWLRPLSQRQSLESNHSNFVFQECQHDRLCSGHLVDWISQVRVAFRIQWLLHQLDCSGAFSSLCCTCSLLREDSLCRHPHRE